MLARIIWLGAFLVLVASDSLARFDPTPTPLLIHAGYQRCVTIRNGPLIQRGRVMITKGIV